MKFLPLILLPITGLMAQQQIVVPGSGEITAYIATNPTVGVNGSCYAMRTTNSVTTALVVAGRICGIFDSNSFTQARVTIQTPTASNVFIDNTTFKGKGMMIGANSAPSFATSPNLPFSYVEGGGYYTSINPSTSPTWSFGANPITGYLQISGSLNGTYMTFIPNPPIAEVSFAYPIVVPSCTGCGGSPPANMMTTDTNQTVTGIKTFNVGQVFNTGLTSNGGSAFNGSTSFNNIATFNSITTFTTLASTTFQTLDKHDSITVCGSNVSTSICGAGNMGGFYNIVAPSSNVSMLNQGIEVTGGVLYGFQNTFSSLGATTNSMSRLGFNTTIGYRANGTTGVTSATCSQFTLGICTAP